MKIKYTFSNRIRNSLIVFFLGIILITAGCYTIESILQPGIVLPKNAFNVKIALKPTDQDFPAEYKLGKGILGVYLPDGWIVKDSIKYSINGSEQISILCFNADAVSFLNSNLPKVESGYHWWGAKSIYEINMDRFKTGVVDLIIITNEKRGNFKTKYVFGDDNEWNKLKIEDPYGIVTQSEFIPITVDFIQSAGNKWENQEWEVYPNPSEGPIYIRQASITNGVVMKVYDLNGRIQKSEVLHEILNYVDLSALSKGTYIVSLEKHGEIKTKRLIIH